MSWNVSSKVLVLMYSLAKKSLRAISDSFAFSLTVKNFLLSLMKKGEIRGNHFLMSTSVTVNTFSVSLTKLFKLS